MITSISTRRAAATANRCNACGRNTRLSRDTNRKKNIHAFIKINSKKITKKAENKTSSTIGWLTSHHLTFKVYWLFSHFHIDWIEWIITILQLKKKIWKHFILILLLNILEQLNCRQYALCDHRKQTNLPEISSFFVANNQSTTNSSEKRFQWANNTQSIKQCVLQQFSQRYQRDPRDHPWCERRIQSVRGQSKTSWPQSLWRPACDCDAQSAAACARQTRSEYVRRRPAAAPHTPPSARCWSTSLSTRTAPWSAPSCAVAASLYTAVQPLVAILPKYQSISAPMSATYHNLSMTTQLQNIFLI